MREKYQKNKFRFICLVVLVVLTCCMTFTGAMLIGSYHKAVDYEVGFYERIKANSDIHTSTGKLNDFAANYVKSLDSRFVDMYFEELDSRQREEALLLLKNNDEGLHIAKAADLYYQQMDIELHAMRLIAAATGYIEQATKEELKGYILTPDELHLCSEEMIAKARDMLGSAEYLLFRNQADKEIGLMVGIEVEDANVELKAIHTKVTVYIVIEIGIAVMLLVFFVLTFVHNRLYMELPLEKLYQSALVGNLSTTGHKKSKTALCNKLIEIYNRDIKELKILRNKVNLLQKANLIDACAAVRVDVTNGIVEKVLLEDERGFASMILKRAGIELPCSFDEYIAKVLPYVDEADRDSFSKMGVGGILSVYAAGREVISENISFVIDGEKYPIRFSTLMRWDPDTEGVIAFLIIRHLSF